MLPFNFAILKLFLRMEEADLDIVMAELADDYQKTRQYKRSSVTEALMTAEANGLLEETRFELDDKERLRIFYRATDTGKEMIKRYIGT
jgi:DNA-binding MarR family transcriptional regulator